MNLPTHLFTGWILGNALGRSAKERQIIMVSSLAPDLDGFGYFISDEMYIEYHHVIGHGLMSAIVFATCFAFLSQRRFAMFMTTFFVIHFHLIMDYFGSGPNWPIAYGWPIFDMTVINSQAWDFDGWQNRLTMGLSFLLTWYIAVRFGRSPVEMVAPRIDAIFVKMARRPFKRFDATG